jgi:hypothetical protein
MGMPGLAALQEQQQEGWWVVARVGELQLGMLSCRLGHLCSHREGLVWQMSGIVYSWPGGDGRGRKDERGGKARVCWCAMTLGTACKIVSAGAIAGVSCFFMSWQMVLL